MAIDTKYTNWQLGGLVALRVLIGWHFLYEGIAKLMKPGWTAAGYLLQSKWLFSGLFHSMAANDGVMHVVNFLNIWGLIFIGLGLIVGAFTRTASLAGMGLILLYYIANPPLIGLYYTIPSEGNYLIVNKNIVELAALFVLFLFPTGKILGMDRLISRLLNRKRS